MRSPLAALLAALLTAFTLLALAGYQVTGPSAGPRLLGRLAASLVELERWVPSHREDIQLVARDRPQESVLVDDLPVDVVIPSQAAVGADEAALRDLLRAAMGRELYEEGSGAWQDEAGGSHLPVTEPVRWTISLLGSGMHDFWRLVLIAAAVLTLAVYAAMVPARRSAWQPLVAGTGIAVVASFAAWLIANGMSRVVEGAGDREIVLILRDGAWLGLRNALALTAGALACLYLWRALVVPRLRDEADYWPDAGELPDSYPSDRT